MMDEKIRLNPFVYISETDIAFYLIALIGIIVPSLWAVLFGITGYFTIKHGHDITFVSTVLIAILTFSFMPFLIYWNYRIFPRKIIKQFKLKEFDKKRYPEHFEFIENLFGKHFIGMKPKLMYNPLDPSESAFTFGTRNQMYIGISGGLIKKFRSDISGFRTILLHEIGHIINGDVEKTFLAVSTWRFLLTFSKLLAFFLGLILIVIFLAGTDLSLFAGITIYFLFFLGIIYILRNKIIRLREFYSDAWVLEQDASSEKIIKSLKESKAKLFSKFEMLNLFHPNVHERIQVLENNDSLFSPDLWVALSMGFFFAIILSELGSIEIFSPESLASAANGKSQQSDLSFNWAIISIFILPILMSSFSSSLHKSILRDIFIKNKKYFSLATLLHLIKISSLFNLAWLGYWIVAYLIFVQNNILTFLFDQLLKLFLNFSIALLYLLIFASLLIRRSFNKKDADKNFLLITILSSLLYVVNEFYFGEILHMRLLSAVSFLIFSILAFAYIKIRYKNLVCPDCSKQIDISSIHLNCPNCHEDLYSWAVYSFSKNAEGESSEA